MSQEEMLIKYLDECNFPKERIIRYGNKFFGKAADGGDKTDEEEEEYDEKEVEEEDLTTGNDEDKNEAKGTTEDEPNENFNFEEICEKCVRFNLPDEEDEEDDEEEEEEEGNNNEEKPFLSVWNEEDIKQEKDLDLMFKKVPFAKIVGKIQNSGRKEKKQDRGNRQFNFGLAALSQNYVCPITKQNRPVMKKGTEKWSFCFELATAIYSKLGFEIPHLAEENHKDKFRLPSLLDRFQDTTTGS